MADSSMAYPLSWPLRQPRTPRAARGHKHTARNLSVASALSGVQTQIRLLGGRGLVVSTNIVLRMDGLPRSGQAMPDDPGVAVYFERKSKEMVFACDRHLRVEHNLRSIAQHLEALRGMERWGVGTIDQAFAGYQALPEDSTAARWWRVLGIDGPTSDANALKSAYRHAARAAHPDVGGSSEAMAAVNAAYQQGLAALKELADA